MEFHLTDETKITVILTAITEGSNSKEFPNGIIEYEFDATDMSIDDMLSQYSRFTSAMTYASYQFVVDEDA
jgi:hypothetical protein